MSAIELLAGVVVPAILNLPFLLADEFGPKFAITSAEPSVPIS